MNDPQQPNGLVAVAASIIVAAHRRDHDVLAAECHPHAVEVVYLGDRAVAVCHDCAADTGFLPRRKAEHIAHQHRDVTRLETPAEPDMPTDRLAA
jgi:hypothetical protein